MEDHSIGLLIGLLISIAVMVICCFGIVGLNRTLDKNLTESQAKDNKCIILCNPTRVVYCVGESKIDNMFIAVCKVDNEIGAKVVSERLNQ